MFLNIFLGAILVAIDNEKEETMTKPTPEWDEIGRAACAHLHVEWVTWQDATMGSNITGGDWRCRDCGVSFIPCALAQKRGDALHRAWMTACGFDDDEPNPKVVVQRLREQAAQERDAAVAAFKQQAQAEIRKHSQITAVREGLSPVVGYDPGMLHAVEIIGRLPANNSALEAALEQEWEAAITVAAECAKPIDDVLASVICQLKRGDRK